MGEIMMYQTEENKINLFKKLHTMLSRPEFAPTAIVCYNDQLAIQVMNFVKEIGLNIPDDLSVIGVDDYQFSKFINPALTTVRHPQEKMGIDAGITLGCSIFHARIPCTQHPANARFISQRGRR
ncbi:substrate-binding domain-containing protein [Weizmannia sp. FSL K6-3076]|uniref:substrate-binding domain-containing protein n=3 Tax=Bacillati TaxID=1783272 RepID=UPI0030FA8032